MTDQSRIKCYVDSCEYWGHNNQCEAARIEVDNMSRRAPGKGDMEIGQLGKGYGEARTSDDTCCETFRPRQGHR
jgi:hypothetical protein